VPHRLSTETPRPDLAVVALPGPHLDFARRDGERARTDVRMSTAAALKSSAPYSVNEPPDADRSRIVIVGAFFTSCLPATGTPRAESREVARMIAHRRTEPVRLAPGGWAAFAPSRREKPRTLRDRRVAPLLRSARGQAGIHAPA
jgi:hypothetical protein